MRRLVFNLHLFIALVAGTFMMILGLTGSIMEFTPELDRTFHPDLSYVTPGQRTLSLREIGDAVSEKFAGEAIVAYLPSQFPNLSWQVVLPSGIVYVNQYTGKVLGIRMRGQTFLGRVRAIHVRLAAGDVGREIMRWSGVAMILSLASGLYLWWPRKRIQITGGWHSARLWFDLHNSLGIFLLIPLAILATTGTVLGFENQLGPLAYKLTHSTRVQAKPAAIPESPTGARQITPDQALTIAIMRFAGAVPYRIQMPAYGGSYQISLLYPQDKITGMRNVISLDPYSGYVLSLNQSSDLSSGDKLIAINEALHTGTIFGTPSRIVVCLTSTMLIVQVWSGLLMWLRRNKVMQAPGWESRV